MRVTKDRERLKGGVDIMALDWESLGRLVRKGTLDAVAMHFIATAATPDLAPPADAPSVSTARSRP